jgi:hypothetical protein
MVHRGMGPKKMTRPQFAGLTCRAAIVVYLTVGWIGACEAKDTDAETRWLTSLPDGQLIVARAAAGPAGNGTEGPALAAMVALALPESQKMDAARAKIPLALVQTKL